MCTMKQIDQENSKHKESLGVTLVHEHVFNRYPFHKRNVSEEFTLNELKKLERYNVKTIVDLTPYTPIGNYERIIKETEKV